MNLGVLCVIRPPADPARSEKSYRYLLYGLEADIHIQKFPIT